MNLSLIMAHPLIILGVIFTALMLPTMFGGKSAKRLAIGFFVSVFGVMLPLFIFFFSAFLVPDWKGGCDHGWVDCFYLGKLALTPLVLWATGALYVSENRLVPPVNRPVILGIFTGSIVASVCFVFGLVTTFHQPSGFMLWLLVPFYIAVWHGISAVQSMKTARYGCFPYLLTICGSIPFWIGSVIWSRRVYESLPDHAPDCFVVTASGRGHESLVGPFTEVIHCGRSRRANQQLVTLWQFESQWRNREPKSHLIFRRVYNRIGPVIAARIQSPWLADLTFLALKPVELAAKITVHIAKERI